jgi:hypothetical protein
VLRDGGRMQLCLDGPRQVAYTVEKRSLGVGFMTEIAQEKSHVKAILIVLLVIFISGIILGYYIWGYQKQKHPDYREMLQQTITYISTIEEKNQELAKEISSLENELASLKTQQGIPVGSQAARLDERIAALEKENADLKAVVSQNVALVQENQQLRQKVQSLVEKMNASRPPKSSGSAPSLPPTQQGGVTH